MNDLITSSQNKKIKFLKSLSTVKGRRKEGHFLVEGPVVLREVIEYKKPTEVFVADDVVEKYKDLIEIFQRNDVKVVAVMAKILKDVLPTSHTQGIVGVFSTWNDQKPLPLSGPLLYIDGLMDPGNLGGIFRSADAFGVRKIYLSYDCVDVYNPKVVRSTMASLFRVAFEEANPSILSELAKNGFTIVALDIQGKEDAQVHQEENVVYVVGNEHHGISVDCKPYITTCIRIPMEKQVDSLNATVATSICLYENYRRRNDK